MRSKTVVEAGGRVHTTHRMLPRSWPRVLAQHMSGLDVWSGRGLRTGRLWGRRHAWRAVSEQGQDFRDHDGRGLLCLLLSL